MPRYQAFSLQIESELPLPELLPVDAKDAAPVADVVLRRTDLTDARPTEADGGPLSWATKDQVCLHFEEGGQFLARQGREILFHPATGVDDDALRHFLLGPMLGVILHQHGYLVLHASAVRIKRSIVAFLAEKGTGKSTLAAAFHAAGHTLVSDDVVPVRVDALGAPLAYPGFPQLKLFPEAAAQLGDGAQLLPRLIPSIDKRAARLTGEFPTGPMPLRRVYVLSDGDAESIEVLAPQQAFISLIRHSFTLALLRGTGTNANHFHQSIALAGRVPVQSLHRRRQIALLPEVVRLVEADLASD